MSSPLPPDEAERLRRRWALILGVLQRLRQRAERMGLSGPELDDVVQDALVRAVERADDPPDEPRARNRWVIEVLSAARQWNARKTGRVAEQLLGEAEAIAELPAYASETWPESVDLWLRAMQEMREEHRHVFERCELDGASIAEVAAEMGVKLNTARSWLQRAWKELRAHMARLDPDAARHSACLLLFGLGFDPLDRAMLGALLDGAHGAPRRGSAWGRVEGGAGWGAIVGVAAAVLAVVAGLSGDTPARAEMPVCAAHDMAVGVSPSIDPAPSAPAPTTNPRARPPDGRRRSPPQDPWRAIEARAALVEGDDVAARTLWGADRKQRPAAFDEQARARASANP
jgi:RNA polymerase sigma factor (sigma-70 family)